MSTLVVDQPAEGVTRITLQRPERLNAMNATLVAELHGELESIARDQTCRVVVLTGAGRGFCAGVDLSGYGSAPGAGGRGRVEDTFATQTHIAALVPRLRSLPQPVIAAVNGAAAGGGLALALASDVRIAGASARFNVAFVRLGISGCDIGVSWLLPRLIGASRAWELMLTGRIIDAEEADRIGLVLRVVPDEDLMEAALETAALIAANSPWGIRMTKEVMWSQLEVGSLQAGIDLENRTQVLSSMTGDMREAVSAFLEKRPPRYGTGAARDES
jgi:enoyl-CoA hydratase